MGFQVQAVCLGHDAWKSQERRADMKPSRKRARKGWIMKQITSVGHWSWRPVEIVRNMHLRVIFSEGPGSWGVYILISIIWASRTAPGRWESSKLQPALRVKSRSYQGEVLHWNSKGKRVLVGQSQHLLQIPDACYLHKTFSSLGVLLGTIIFMHFPTCPSASDLATYPRTCDSGLFIIKTSVSMSLTFYCNQLISATLKYELYLQLYFKSVTSLPLLSVCTLWKTC